jgi:hypothetical protein
MLSGAGIEITGDATSNSITITNTSSANNIV